MSGSRQTRGGASAVEHGLYGRGVVQSWRRGGRVAVVAFEREPLPVEVPSRELRSLEEATTSEKAAPAVAGPALQGTVARVEALQTIEAMRLGVVPAARIDAYTVGRAFELELVDEDLREASSRGAVRAFLGDYGVGKTHLLEIIQHRALDANYLTARVVLDPEETSPAHPKRVYRALVRHLAYPDRPWDDSAGLEPLLEKAAGTPEVLERFGVDKPGAARAAAAQVADGQGFHLYLSAAIAYMRTLAATSGEKPPRGVAPGETDAWVHASRELLLDWIEGHPTISNQEIDAELSRLRGGHPRIYSLKDFRPWARIYGYQLSGLASLARAAGYEGLVVLVDEAEFYGLLTPTNREFARTLFKAWTWAAVGAGDEGAQGAQGAGSVPFDEGELAMGGYGVLKDLPARYGDGGGLYVVYAMTPNSDGIEALSGAIPAGTVTHLRPMEPYDYAELARRVADFYASAFPENQVPAAVVGPLGKVLSGLIQSGYVSNPRHAMKFVIEFLDLVRYHPDRIGSVVRNLQESLFF